MSSAVSSVTIHDLLHNTKVSAVIAKGREVVTVNSDETPLDGFKRIVSKRVLSAPVWDSHAKKWIGFLDTRDLVSFVVFQAEEEDKKRQSSNLLSPPPQDLRVIFDAAAKFYQKPLDGITTAYLAHKNKFIPVTPNDSLLTVVRILAEGAHRVPVIEASSPEKLIDIVSQSTLVQFLFKHHQELAKDLSASIADIKLGSRPVIPVTDRMTALETFKIMAKYNRSGVAVVNSAGTLVGNTSASDLKLYIQNPTVHSPLLRKPINDFLAAIRQAEISENPNTRAPTMSVPQNATLDKIISKLAATKVHRLFVADDASGYKPVAVVSITDVLRYLVTLCDQVDHKGTPQVVVQSS